MEILHITKERSFSHAGDYSLLSTSSLLRDLCFCGPSRPIDLLGKGHMGNSHTNMQTTPQ